MIALFPGGFALNSLSREIDVATSISAPLTLRGLKKKKKRLVPQSTAQKPRGSTRSCAFLGVHRWDFPQPARKRNCPRPNGGRRFFPRPRGPPSDGCCFMPQPDFSAGQPQMDTAGGAGQQKSQGLWLNSQVDLFREKGHNPKKQSPQKRLREQRKREKNFRGVA